MFGFGKKQEEQLGTVTLDITNAEVYTVTVDGIIEEAQLRQLQADAAVELDRGGEVSVLMDLRAFKGMKVPPRDDHLEFLLKYDPQMKKIAVVTEARMKDRALVYFCKGYRNA